jgi:HAD superfamily hydrolase (TIGR01509 family)
VLGVVPARCLALDDAPAGILAAQRAGMQVIAVPSPLASARL